MIPRRSIPVLFGPLFFLAVFHPGRAAGQTVPVVEEIEAVDICCHGVFTRADLFERIVRSGPDRILGNQIRRFNYAVACYVLYPLTEEDRLILRFQAECREWCFPDSTRILVEWNGETWMSDSLFTVVYDIQDGWLSPLVIPLGAEQRRVLRPFDSSVLKYAAEKEMKALLHGCYFGHGKGPAEKIQIFAVIPVLSTSGVPWTNQGETFRVSLAKL
ncbi:MAG: hypothetical protein JW958_14705 [Candidatus Eisenbacteria bacterium]|nr:hypothetical protein [Candidatus Eisenbacteria bacterium]